MQCSLCFFLLPRVIFYMLFYPFFLSLRSLSIAFIFYCNKFFLTVGRHAFLTQFKVYRYFKFIIAFLFFILQFPFLDNISKYSKRSHNWKLPFLHISRYKHFFFENNVCFAPGPQSTHHTYFLRHGRCNKLTSQIVFFFPFCIYSTCPTDKNKDPPHHPNHPMVNNNKQGTCNNPSDLALAPENLKCKLCTASQRHWWSKGENNKNQRLRIYIRTVDILYGLMDRVLIMVAGYTRRTNTAVARLTAQYRWYGFPMFGFWIIIYQIYLTRVYMLTGVTVKGATGGALVQNMYKSDFVWWEEKAFNKQVLCFFFLNIKGMYFLLLQVAFANWMEILFHPRCSYFGSQT